jgi:hypothetical protein
MSLKKSDISQLERGIKLRLVEHGVEEVHAAESVMTGVSNN